jgi:ABC-type enterobactin transport system permease subunit
MKFIEYARRRKAGFSHKAASILSNRDIGDAVAYALVCIALVFVALSTAAETIEEGRQESARRATAPFAVTVDRLEKLIVACLQGGVINVSGVAFECKAESLGIKL